MSVKAMKDNLLTIWRNTSPALLAEGSRWYHIAHSWILSLSELTGIDFVKVAGVVAVTSAIQKWDIQMILVPRMLKHYLKSGETMGFGWPMISQREKAERVLAGDFDAVSGRKIRAFWFALMGDPEAVVIDRWAYRAAVGEYNGEFDARAMQKKGVFEDVQEAYREAALEVGVVARDFQAALWVAVREPSFSFAENDNNK